MNLDKLLKKLELNKNNENEQKTYPFEIGGETYEVKTFTRSQKRDFMYAFETGQNKLKIGDVIKRSIPFILRFTTAHYPMTLMKIARMVN